MQSYSGICKSAKDGNGFVQHHLTTIIITSLQKLTGFTCFFNRNSLSPWVSGITTYIQYILYVSQQTCVHILTAERLQFSSSSVSLYGTGLSTLELQ